MNAPLQGIRILDFSRVLAGPFASMTLADMGADVVKVEHPERGDDTRGFGPPFASGVSTYFLSINRGKRSIALDLKSPEDRARALGLADKADVVLENFRPGVMARLGLGPEVLRERNPGLVYCSISGFGREDPRAGYDLVVQGMSGIPSITGEVDGAPVKCGASIADLVSGQNAVQGILAALLRRARTGEGALVDIPMIDGQLSLLTYHASGLLNGGVAPARLGNHHPSIHPYGAYKASDTSLNIAVGNDALFVRFCSAIGRPEWARDARFASNASRVAHRSTLDPMLLEVLEADTAQGWCLRLEAAGVPAGPINTVEQALEQVELQSHPHPGGAGEVRTAPLPIRIDGAPRAAERGPPALGAHTAEVLADWGVE
jgi:crotonobetainyl-CoA:carnitine CoA-transferase CaiB-like acyl-CoA transferase